MRKDMRKVIGIRRGTRKGFATKGYGFDPAEFRKVDWDADDTLLVAGRIGPGQEGRYTGRPRNERGYNAKPIERFLYRQVGRSWNDVRSEIAAQLRFAPRSMKLVDDLVALRAGDIDGQLMLDTGRGLVAASERWAPRFFVDPRSGRLHRNIAIVTHRMRQRQLAASAERERAQRLRELGPLLQLHLLADGNWWEVTLCSRDEAYQSRDVVISAGLSTLSPATLYGRDGVFAIQKRPLSSRELIRYRLR